MEAQLKLVKINNLLPHEKINRRRIPKLLLQVKTNKFLRPIIVDSNSQVILDGHHRFEVSKILGLKKIPVFLVDYKSRRIKLFSRRKNYEVSKKEVVARGIAGRLYPYKTTKHIIENLGECFVSLEALS